MPSEEHHPQGRRDPETRLAQLILSVFALYARAEANWMSVASVIQLMGDLGVDGQAVRSAVSRLKRRGALISSKRNGQAGYLLATDTINVFSDGDVRIFERPRADLEDGWVLVMFSIPESERDKRHSLRTTLARLGFGTASPGVWIAPGTLVSDARHALERQGLESYSSIFVGTHASRSDLRADVREWWNLDELDSLYADFQREFQPVQDAIASRALTPIDAFRAYVPMLTHWRRIPYRDPGLPAGLLPADWSGEPAWALFEELNGRLRPLARKHAVSVINGLTRR